MKNIIIPIKYNFIDQGLIFTCARAESYENCNIHGLIISARCDIEHNKSGVFHYLPVVKINDWLHRDFIHISCSRLIEEQLGIIRNCLEQNGFSLSILITQKPKDIFNILFLNNKSDKKIAKSIPQLEKSIKRLELLENLIKLKPHLVDIIPLFSEFTKFCYRLIEDLIFNKISGYYFLNSLKPEYIDDFGYVVLLRQIRHLPIYLAHAITHGFDLTDYHLICKKHPECYGLLDISKDNFAMPIGLVRSPEIEHLMQNFSLLFSRIGVEDPDYKYINKLINYIFDSGGKNG